MVKKRGPPRLPLSTHTDQPDTARFTHYHASAVRQQMQRSVVPVMLDTGPVRPLRTSPWCTGQKGRSGFAPACPPAEKVKALRFTELGK